MNFMESDLEQTCLFIFDEHKLKANKLVLSCNSPVFELMFYGPMASSEVQITDIKPEDFKQMLDYVCTKSITFTSVPNAWSLYYISHKYFLSDLKKECLRYIYSNLSISTLLLSYEYAQLYNLKEVAIKCWREILLSAKEVLCIDDYHMKASTFCALLDETYVNAKEEDLIEAAIKWANNECVINNLDKNEMYYELVKAGIFERLRFASLGRTSLQYMRQLVPDNSSVVPLMNPVSERRRILPTWQGLRYRFRETYKIERNIQLTSEAEFCCSMTTSCKIVVYGIAIAQPHQGGLDMAFSSVEASLCDSSSKLLSKSECGITTQGDYEVPGLVHFTEGVQLDSNVPYEILIKFRSNCKKPNQLLCFYLGNCINGQGNSVRIEFDDRFYGGVVRGISYYVV